MIPRVKRQGFLSFLSLPNNSHNQISAHGQQQVTLLHRDGEAQTIMLLTGTHPAGSHQHPSSDRSGCGTGVNIAGFPHRQPGPLTFVCLRVRVLDVGREFRENVHSRCVGLGTASCQTRTPGQTESLRNVHIRKSLE